MNCILHDQIDKELLILKQHLIIRYKK